MRAKSIPITAVAKDAIVLKWTTQEQLNVICKLLAEKSEELSKTKPEAYDSTAHPDFALAHGLVNFLADCEIPGYEMS